MHEAKEFQAHMQHLEQLLQQAEQSADPAAQARLQEIVSGLLELHGAGLARLLQLISEAGETGTAILDACGRDELVNALLVLHDLHPRDLEMRVRGALEKVGPYLASHGGQVELLSITPEGVVNLRLEGSCHGCPSSRVTLQSTIEHEIYAAAPEVAGIAVEGLAEPTPPQESSGVVPRECIGINGRPLQSAQG